jgi:membrane-associated phospholipid phosphatase
MSMEATQLLRLMDSLMLEFITNFGDQALILPFTAVVGLMLFAAGWTRGALAWIATIGGTLSFVLFLKLGFLACGHLTLFPQVRSPSGHTAAAAVTYGGLLAIFLRAKWRCSSYWALPSATVIALVVGCSRMGLSFHSFGEVAIGGMVGVVGAFIAVMAAGPPPSQFKIGRVLAIGCVLLVALYGLRLPAESAIHNLAFTLWPLSLCRDH